MRGKAEGLREEVDAKVSKILPAKPNHRYTYALHHHAWALLKHCMQHKGGYWLRNCLPSFAEAVDATVLVAVERVLGVSYDPSMYGTDTNPLGSVLDRGSFNAPSSARRYDHFRNDARGSASYAAAVHEAWARLQAANAGHLNDADARVMEREAKAASGSQKGLMEFLDQANNSRFQINDD
eukprot:jgi/Tetstr1/447748/TSEL_035081.t1